MVGPSPETQAQHGREERWPIMRTILRSYWNDAAWYQKFAYAVAALLIASGIFHAIVLLITGGPWEGPLSWRKAISFGLSFGLTTLSLTWVTHFLPKRRVLMGVLLTALGIAMFVEVFLTTMQVWRGVPSHFNFGTRFDAAVFVWMGIMIAVVGVVVLAITVMSFRSLDAPRSLAWAIRAGLLFLIVGQAVGGLMIRNGNAKVFDPQTRQFVLARVAGTSTYGEAGNMKSSHAVSLHAIQVLPVLAWLLTFTHHSERTRARLVLVATLGYLALTAVAVAQTFSGRAPTQLPSTLLLAAVSGAVLLLFSYGLAVRSLVARE